MNSDLHEAWALADAGDVAGLMRHLYFTADGFAIGDIAPLAGRAAELAGFTDMAEAAAAVTAAPDRPRALYAYGYACIERDVSFLAIPALQAALRLAPGSLDILQELVIALENEYRHGEAVAVLTEHEAELPAWPERYLLAYNALMAGDVARADAEAARLPFPDEEHWVPAHGRLSRMLARAREVQALGRLDDRDLRGWHFVLSGGVLAVLSSYGFDEGMTGRYAYLAGDFGTYLYGLLRLRTVLEAAGRRPRTVSLLPGRGDRALGLAASRVLGLPAEPFAPGRADTVVIAHDLGKIDDELLVALHGRADGQILYEYATCWTEPPAVSADVNGMLCQTAVAPWEERPRVAANGVDLEFSADDRTAEELAEEILRADPTPDGGDGGTPPDSDEALAGFAASVAPLWPADGPRDRVRSPGPVRSVRFL